MMKLTPEMQTALIAHLSKEIELSTNLLVAQRTRNNLLVAFGPFIVLGAIASNGVAVQGLQSLSAFLFGVIIVVVLCTYSGLGYLAALIEERLWKKCNEWRAEVARIAAAKVEVYQFDTIGLYRVYMAIFGLLGVIFALLLWLLHQS